MIEIHSIGPHDTQRLAMEIGAEIRDMDRRECLACGMSPFEAVWMSIENSVSAFGCFENGRCIAVWGITAASILGGEAQPWLLTTRAVERHKKLFLQETQRWVRRTQKQYAVLETMVYAEYGAALRWLRWLGFTVHEAVPFGHNNEMFCRVTLGGAA